MEQLQEFFKQLPQDIQQKILSLSPEEQKAVLMQMLNELQRGIPQNNQQQVQMQPNQQQLQQFEEGGDVQNILVEAEGNENITIQNGTSPDMYNGYYVQQSHNPVSGQSTYELPKDNPSHDNDGVKMLLTEGDVINSDKTKINLNYKIYGKNFKGKTFKEASDFISKKENDIQKTLLKLNKAKQSDSTTEESAELMLGKLAMERNNLNELQEITLEQNKQLEGNKLLESYKKEYGGYIKDINKYDRILNTKNISKKQFIKAKNGINTTAEKIKNFTDILSNNKGMSNQEVFQNMSSITQVSQLPNTTRRVSRNPYPEPIFNKSNVIGSFKEKIASEESGGYTNPYIAIAGLNEKDVEGKTYEQVKHLAASSGVGKYQFIWNIHKSDIKKITGIDSIEDFRNNPQAQETFMDWFIQNDLLPGAIELKQKYQLPYTIEQIMAGVHLEGKAGLEKKIKSNTLNTSTMAKNFKNATSDQYMNSFEHGGYIYAGGGFNFTTWPGDKMIKGKNAAQYSAKDLQDIASYYFPDKKYTSNSELQQDILNYLGDDYGKYVIPIPKGTITGKNSKQSLVDNKFGDDWNLAIQKLKEGIIQPIPPKGLKKLQIPPSEEDKDGTVPKERISANPNPTDPPAKSTPSTSAESIGSEVAGIDNGIGSDGKGSIPSSSILDKLKYAAREALPYLDNLRLLREGRIMPTLQQKPYQNPYDNMVTDINIQSNLNDIDRGTLAMMAQATGNPSVRNTRMAQFRAIADNNKNQLYSQKYNQENQLKNQKNIGQMEYLNKREDVNRELIKRYEAERLQTIENQRQQRHFAMNQMMNDYLRKQEQNDTRDLALSVTNYDWNPYTQTYESNDGKTASNFAYKKMTYSPLKSEYNNIVKLDGEEYYRNKKGDLIKISQYSN